MDYYSAINEMDYWYGLHHRWSLKHYVEVKEASQERQYILSIVRFYPYEMSRTLQRQAVGSW